MYGHYTDQAVLAVIPSENTENAKKEMNENAMVDNIRHDNAKIYLFLTNFLLLLCLLQKSGTFLWATPYLHCVSIKSMLFSFCNNFIKFQAILMKFGRNIAH